MADLNLSNSAEVLGLESISEAVWDTSKEKSIAGKSVKYIIAFVSVDYKRVGGAILPI